MNTPNTPLSLLRQVYCFALFLYCLPFLGMAQTQVSTSDFWKNSVIPNDLKINRTSPLPRQFSAYHLRFSELKNNLTTAPSRFINQTTEYLISLPSLDGYLSEFKVLQSPVFAKDLAEKYPDLQSYYLQNTENSAITGRLDITSLGAYFLISDPLLGDYYLEPYSNDSDAYYILFQAKDQGDASQQGEFFCGAKAEAFHEKINEEVKSSANSCILRKFRLSVSATGEYTQWHGGTVAGALEKIMLLVSHTNLVFERDLGISFELIAENEQIIFTNPNSDPFTNDNKFTLLGQNQTVNNTFIGEQNYDLGIVVGIVGGGVAQFNSVCNSNKAQASAGSTWSPEGYPLESTFIHEIGHKFGATHSFNNFCDGARNNFASFETGSGSSIMSYAGACAPSVTYPREHYFHTSSRVQIFQNFGLNPNFNCAEEVPLGTTEIQANAGESKILPVATPFELTGNTATTSADVLYSWDQTDIEITAAPPSSNSTEGPAFRSYFHKSNPVRSFPKIECIVNPFADTDCDWETLPDVERTMNFRYAIFTIMDGVGCASTDNTGISFVQTASNFAVSIPNGGESYLPNQNINITWDTGDTELTPINASEVDILLSNDGGYTYPFTLAENVPNTGSANINLPQLDSDLCRVKIKGSNHLFFDLSDDNFKISTLPDFTISSPAAIQEFCGDIPNSVSFEIQVEAAADFAQTVSFPASDNGGTNNIIFSPNVVTPPATVSATINGSISAGTQTFSITAVSGNQSGNIDLTVRQTDGTPNAPILLTPAANSINLNYQEELSWSDIPNAHTYELEIADSPTFSNPFLQLVTQENAALIDDLAVFQLYYWRVRAINACAVGAWSEPAAFRTKQQICYTYSAENTPREISAQDYADAFVLIGVPDEFIISEAKIPEIRVNHTHVGDLSSSIINPDGDRVKLFYRPGLTENTPYGCVHDDLLLSFDDNAELGHEDLRTTCAPVPSIAISGSYRPMEALSLFQGKQANGQWLFNINDLTVEDGGELLNVDLELCRDDIQVANNLSASSTLLTIEQGSNAIIEASNFSISDPNGSFQILTLPTYGSLFLNGNVAHIGDHFSLANLQANELTYQHNGSTAVSDSFLFDASNSTGEWAGIHDFSIAVTFSAPIATVSVAQTISCTNANDGVIMAVGSYGNPPYQYSLDGENYQDNPDFAGLGTGEYTVFITDALNNTTESQIIFLSNPNPLSLGISADNQEIIVQAFGGTGSYSFSLDGINFQTENTFTTSTDGTYNVTVQDENGCTTTGSILINNLAVSSSLIQTITCHNDNNAILEINTQNGIPPFQYSINEGAFQDENVFSDLAAGIYTGQVKDGNGLLYSTSSIEVINPLPITAEIEIDGYNIEINPENVQLPVSFSFAGADFSTENTFIGAPQSSYDIIVQDAAGCTENFSAEIDILPPSIATAETFPVTCEMDADGQLSFTGTAGIPPYEYRIIPNAFQIENTFTGLAAGIYSLEIKDVGGYISETIEVEVSEPTAIEAFAQSIDEDISIWASGGTGDLAYSIDGASFQNNSQFTDLSNGIYTFTVRDENGCTFTFEYTHTVNSFSVQSSSSILNPCEEDAPFLVEVCVDGGIAPYEISANPPASTVTALDSDDCEALFRLTFYDVDVSTIQINATDLTGSQFINIVNVQVADTLTLQTSLNENNLTVIAGSGTSPYSFSLDGVNYQESGYFPDLALGTYSIYALDANGCSAETEVFIDYSNNENIYLANELKIYPNPGRNLIYIESDLLNNELFDLVIFDAAGKLVYQEKVHSYRPQHSINISHLPIGFYEIQAKSPSFNIFNKLIVIR